MIDPSPERVTWYYGEWQSAYENLDIPNLRLEEGLPTSFDASKRNIVVLDDLMAETDERVTNLFTKKSHHCNTSVIYLVQNLFPKNKESRTISLNSQYIVVFKNPRDVSQMTTLAKQMYPGRVKFVQEAFADATSTPYGYILVDLKQDTPEDLRLRTSILPDDAVQYFPPNDFWRENLDWSLDKLSAQLRIYHDFDEGISITFGIYIIHKLVCITCRYQFG